MPPEEHPAEEQPLHGDDDDDRDAAVVHIQDVIRQISACVESLIIYTVTHKNPRQPSIFIPLATQSKNKVGTPHHRAHLALTPPPLPPPLLQPPLLLRQPRLGCA